MAEKTTGQQNSSSSCIPSVEEKKEWFEQGEFFKTFDKDEIQFFAEHSQLIELKKNDVLFSEGDPGDSLFLIRRGELVIQKTDEEGQPITIAQFLKGDSLGEMDLMTSSPRTANCVAMKKSSLLCFPGEGCFEKLIEEYPTVSAKIIFRFMTILAGKIRSANSLIKENSPLVQELKKQVYRDKLSGLYNKTFLSEKMNGLIKKKPESLALLMFKPDNFKYINDTFGHDAGDNALMKMGNAVLEYIDDEERVIRYQGNEHAIVVPGADRAAARETAVELQQVLRDIDWSDIFNDPSFELRSSFGISLYPDHGETTGEIINAAHELPLIGRDRGGSIILFPEDK